MEKDAEQKASEKSSQGDINHDLALKKNKFVAPFRQRERNTVI